MNKISKHIEIVSTTTRKFSSMSHESREAICVVLKKHYTNVSVTIINDITDLEALVLRKPDLVFLGMNFIPLNHNLGREDPAKVWLTDYFDEHNIAYTGSASSAHQLEYNKPFAKQCVLDAGLTTADFYVAGQDDVVTEAAVSLTYPLFIKPTNRGGGTGIDGHSVVHDFEQLKFKVNSIKTELGSDSLVESYLSGREFSVAILKDELTGGYTTMPIELIANPDQQGIRILSKLVKSSNTESAITVSDSNVHNRVSTLAIGVFHALGARDYGRIDIRMDERGRPHFLEANLIPSLISGYGSFPKACLLNAGIDYEPMLLKIVQLGLSRNIERTGSDLDNDDLVIPTLETTLEPV